jgi:transposase-like protein
MSGSGLELSEIAGIERWTEREAQAALRAWRRRGESLQAFAREHGLSPHRLRWWSQRSRVTKAKTRSMRQAAEGAPSEAIEFVQAVVVGRAMHGDVSVLVRLPDGIEIELRDAVHASAVEVARLVAELRRAGA